MNAAVAMGICDVSGQIVNVNQAMADMLGYSIKELCALNVRDFADPRDAPDTWISFAKIARGELDHSRREKYFRRSDGEIVCTDMTTSLLRDCTGRPEYMVSIMQDITERQRLHAELRHQALHDPLTGLPNRRLVFERMAELFSRGDRGQRLGLCYIDLDGFKTINDSLGHDVGDALLIAVADRVHTCVSGLGHLVGRMGGDEFVVVIADSRGIDDVAVIADTALAALEEPFRIGDHELTISASIGVVERAVAEANIADLVKAADTTMSWAKAAGKRQRTLYDPRRPHTESARRTLATTMPAALENGDFTLEYQPVVRLTDGAVQGFEALVRWRHPQLGLLLPQAFLGVAEETGLIAPLGRWVLEEACRQAQSWQSDPAMAGLFVSVNISSKQIHDSAIPGLATWILRETGLDPTLLQVELNESTLLANPGEPNPCVLALSSLGIRIAIDHFGSGMSHLAHLCALPVHSLKLSQSFVDALRGPRGADPATERVIATMVTLAHSLGLSTTAEGVETFEQAQRLQALDCDTAQGWLFGRPGPVTEVRGMAHARPRRP
jgi:diguanylate cyclase (GGDEF)-like protein/PAS domain S-box-containing protein